ncbi:MAG: hypothetical protein KME35_17050 [Aphanocapsa sp. GSE-SYN-MK-11-07L]|jgi:hypothetical protein|nr:hypothetical protein [Aphanocapsa sp. GSE-SYN-MK-11-07L]
MLQVSDQPTAAFFLSMTPESFDHIAQALAAHQQSLRIKKLMFATVKGSWENDQTTLDQHPIAELIQAACDNFSGAEQFTGRLMQVVDTLNKKAEYVMIADLICHHLRSLYPAANPTPVEVPNWFDLRCQIVKSINPLRTKILLFSALYHLFSNSEADWVSLKMHSLDNLLKQFLSRRLDLSAMTEILNSTVLDLHPALEYTAVASTLLSALQAWQTPMPVGRQDTTEITILAALDADDTEVGTVGNLANDDQNSSFLTDLKGAPANGR